MPPRIPSEAWMRENVREERLTRIAEWRDNRIWHKTDPDYMRGLFWGIAYLALYHSPFLPSDLRAVLHVPDPPAGTNWRVIATPLHELERLEFIELNGTTRSSKMTGGQKRLEWRAARGLEVELAKYIRDRFGPRPAYLPAAKRIGRSVPQEQNDG